MQTGTEKPSSDNTPLTPFASGLKGVEASTITITGTANGFPSTEMPVEYRAQIVNLSFEPIFVWTDEDGIVEWNKGSEQLYGYSRDEALGQNVHQLLNTVHTLPPASLLGSLTRSGEWTAELRQTAKDGREVYVESRQQVLEVNGHRFVVETNRDITERRRVEAERQRLLELEKKARMEAEEANRAKDEFLAVLSHELRTPLHSIKGWVSILQTGGIDEEMRDHGLEVIARNVNSQNALIEDILDVSRIVLGKLRLETEDLSLVSILENVIDEGRPVAESNGITLTAEIDRTADEMEGDRFRLRQIIYNLLNNAVKFTPEGGRVDVRLERLGNTARLSVTDTGAGISAELLPRIFDRFQQADSSSRRRHSGLGLGLAIAKHLAELHGGTIMVASDGESCGSTFTLRLPLQPIYAAMHSALAGHESGFLDTSGSVQPLKGFRLLVVDDDEDALQMLALVLQNLGAAVDCASTARDALKRLRAEQYDLMISDLGMAKMDGYDLIHTVREKLRIQNSKMPAIALSGYAGAEDREHSLSSGFQMHISKPVDMPAIVEMITKLLPVRGSRNG